MVKFKVIVGKEEVLVQQLLPWSEKIVSRFKTAELESVKVGKKDGNGCDSVILVSDSGEESVGEGLSPEALQWLKNCILKVISS
jgi:hypothetical protein